jgi:anion-transporting  ArsA/GET3 family ATPase
MTRPAVAPPRSGPVERVLAHPLVFVTGKGGSGKSTVCAALARVAVRPVRELAAIDPEAALAEWLGRQVGAPAAALLRRSRTFSYLVAAAPGAAELVTVGKVADEASHRRVIADGPSTGHALAMLAAPRTYAAIAAAGRIARDAHRLQRRLEDRAFTVCVGVALPEPMAVAELLQLEAALPGVIGHGLDLIVVNAVHPDRFSDEEAERLEAASGRCPALEAVLVEHRRARREAAQVAGLVETAMAPVVALPFVFPPEDRVARLARELTTASAP